MRRRRGKHDANAGGCRVPDARLHADTDAHTNTNANADADARGYADAAAQPHADAGHGDVQRHRAAQLVPGGQRNATGDGPLQRRTLDVLPDAQRNLLGPRRSGLLRLPRADLLSAEPPAETKVPPERASGRAAITWDYAKLAVGYTLAGLATVSLWIVRGNMHSVNATVVFWLGGLSGWIVGMLLSPRGEEERQHFPVYLTSAASFVSGFVLAKLDDIFKAVVASQPSPQIWGAPLLCAATFCLGIVMTYVGRRSD